MFPHPPFSPDEFALCYREYAAALLELQYQQDGAGWAPPLADGTCLIVALRIIEASANGVREFSRLKRFALTDLVWRHWRCSSDQNFACIGTIT